MTSNELQKQRTPGKIPQKAPYDKQNNQQQQQLQLMESGISQTQELVEKVEFLIQSARTANNTQRFGAFQNQTLQQIRQNHKENLQQEQRGASHSHHQSLSETRSLKSFRSLQDERLQRRLVRKLDSSMTNEGQNNGQGGGDSKTRQLSNVREMINSEEETKLFEQKFKGSLQKLDAFEKEWNDFKYNINNNNASNTVNTSQEADISRSDTSKIHQSFDGGQGLKKQKQYQGPFMQAQQQVSIQVEYNSQGKGDKGKGLADFRNNRLDQINESPRESILQSPSTNKANQKSYSVTQQAKLQNNNQPIVNNTSAFNSVQKPLPVASNQNSNQNSQCKTLQIDLNEELYNNTLVQQANNSKQALQAPKLQQAKSQDNGKGQIKTPQQQQNLQKKTITGGFQGSVGMNIKSQENNRAARQRSSSQSKGRTEAIQLSSLGVQKKDDLVERVIESIKVLNKREDEVKKEKDSQKPASQNATKKPAVVPSVQTQAHQDNLVNAPTTRRRTNTLTIEERPNLLQMTAQNVSGNNQKQISKDNHQQQAQPSVRNQQQNLSLAFQGSSFVKSGMDKISQNRTINNDQDSTPNQRAVRQQDNHTKNQQNKSPTPQEQSIVQSTKIPSNQLSQQSKEKVEQLRKAFTNSKDNQVSKSTKTLQNSTTIQNKIAQNHNFKMPPSSQHSSSTNTSQIQQPNSVNNKPVTVPQNSASNLNSNIKTTKRTDINLIHDEGQKLPVNNNAIANSSISPTKTSIMAKKNSTTTPQQKLQVSASPQQNTNQNFSQQQQQQSNLNIATNKVGSHVSHKNKNRRQPTQTSIDCTVYTKEGTHTFSSNQNLTKTPDVSNKIIPDSTQAVIERVDGEKVTQKSQKHKTLLDNYTSASPDTQLGKKKDSAPPSKNQSNSSMVKKHKSDVQATKLSSKEEELGVISDLTDTLKVESDFLAEQPKKLNFQPTQEPSFNWNASPEKPNEKLRSRPIQNQQLQETQYIEQQKPPISQRSMTTDFQIKIGPVINIDIEQEQETESKILFPSVVQKIQQKQQKQDQQAMLNNRSNLVETTEGDYEDIDDENRIENKLANLLEETRRKLLNYDEDDSSSQSEKDLSGQAETGFIQIQQSIRNKAQTPQIPVSQHYSYSQQLIGSHQQSQVQIPMGQQQQQPFHYEQQQQQQYQQYMYSQQQQHQPQYQGYMYSGHHAPVPQQNQQQPMITIINPPPYQQQQQYLNQPMYSPGLQYGIPMAPPQSLQTQPQAIQIPHSLMQQQQQSLDQQQQQYMGAPPGMFQQLRQQNFMQAQNSQSMIIGVDSQFYYPKQAPIVPQQQENPSFLDDSNGQYQHQKQIQLQQQQQYSGGMNKDQQNILMPIQHQPYMGRQSMDNTSMQQQQQQQPPHLYQYEQRVENQQQKQQQNQYQIRMGRSTSQYEDDQ